MMQRRTFIAGSAALGAIASAPRAARAAATVTTQLSWIKDVQYGGFWMADANGYFRDEGITANIISGGPNITSIPAIVAAGRADIGIDQFERVVDANAAGADLVAIGALYQSDPSGLLSLPAKPVRTARDILGKRMGLQQGAKQFIDAILKVNHLPLDYTEVVVGYDPESLVQGACDAFLCYVTNEPLELAVRKIPYVVTRFDQLGYVTYASALFCRRDYLTANRATVLGYMRALQRGWAAAIKDPHAAAQLAVNTYGAALGLDIRQQLAISTVQIPLLEGPATQAHGLMWMDKQRVAGPIYTTLRASGRTNLPPVDRVVDMSIIDALNHHA